MNKKVTKAVITAAGYGTRFLPATKNIPKELLPIINKPTISYIVDKCIAAGIRDIIIVTRFGNHAVEDYFDSEPTLEKYLIDKGKEKLAKEIKEVYRGANFIFVRQNPDLPYGNAAPLYSTRALIGEDEPFVYSYGDSLIFGEGAGEEELVIEYSRNPADVILNCVKASKEQISQTGAEVRVKEGTNLVTDIVEKPPVSEIESDILSTSPYLLTGKIFKHLYPLNIQKGQEFLMQDGIDEIMKEGGVVRANITKGKFLTNGDPLSYLMSTVEIALSREDLKDNFLSYLRSRVKELNGL